MEQNIDAYLRGELPLKDATGFVNPLGATKLADDGTEYCSAKAGPPVSKQLRIGGQAAICHLPE